MRAAIYTRVSQDAKKTGRSVAEQEKECRAWCEREGWTVEAVHSDNDIGASRFAKKDRREWSALMERLERGGIDALIVWEPSRATRDRAVWAALYALCVDAGIKFGANGHLYDLSDPDDAFQLDLFFALATREVGATKKRVERAMRANAEAGKPHGRLLYGYMREYDARTGAMVSQLPDETIRQAIAPDGTVTEYSRAGIVRDAARRVASGEARNAIASDFNARGIPVPSPWKTSKKHKGWDLSQIRRMTTNYGYIGKRVFQGKVIGDAVWPAILDDETFYTCLNRIEATPANTRAGTLAHVLSGIAKCGVCGGTIRVIKNRGTLSYACATLRVKALDGTILKHGHCVSRKKETVEQLVTALVIERLSRSDALDLLAPDNDTSAREAAGKAGELRARLDALVAQAVSGDLSAAFVAKAEAQLLPQIEEAERQAARARVVPILRDAVRPDLAQAWSTFPIERQREIISALMEIEILPTDRRNRTFDPASVRITWRSDTPTGRE
jgi:site-specific DNA recombinase